MFMGSMNLFLLDNIKLVGDFCEGYCTRFNQFLNLFRWQVLGKITACKILRQF